MRILAIFCGFALLTAAASDLGAAEKMTMKVFPAVSFAPGGLTVHTSIEASTENRAIEVVADSPDYYRSSTIELAGADAPRITVVEFHNLPGGTYQISAKLVGSTGQTRAAARQFVNVIPRPGRGRN